MTGKLFDDGGLSMTVSASRVYAVVTWTLVSTFVLGAIPLRADEETLRCESSRNRYRYCRADTDNRVTLTRERSRRRCVLWSTWGYDKRGVWVDNGCRAEFRVGKGGLSGGQTAAIVGVAGAIIAGTAIAVHKGKKDPQLPTWAEGRYRGHDQRWNGDIQLEVFSSGAVEGFVTQRDSERFTGRFENDRLYLGPDEFKVSRDGDGFKARDTRDSRREIKFQRVN